MGIKNFLSYKHVMILSLFLIACLHAIAFGFVQYPSNFLTKDISIKSHEILLLILYGSAILTALLNQILTRKLGLKTTLVLGLFFILLESF